MKTHGYRLVRAALPGPPVLTLALLLVLLLAAQASPAAFAQEGRDSLYQGFVEPPVSARPKALWDWTRGNVSLSRLTYELEEAKRMGMGGFDIWDVGLEVDPDSVVPAGPPFMGPESVAAIGHAVREGTRLGLELGLVVSSSWNAGGSWVPYEHGVMGLFRSRVPLRGPRAFSGVLPFPELPDRYGERHRMLIERDATGRPAFFRDVAVLAFPVRADSTLAAGEVVDLTEAVDAAGRLRWEVPEGAWEVVRYVGVPTGQPLMIPSPRSNGRMIDHFSREATEAHLRYIVDRLLPETGPFEGTALKYLYTDSYEANSAAWTPRLPDEFLRRRGYDLTPYLPALDSFTVVDEETTRRFLFDFRKTLSDLIVENHYAAATAFLRPYGLGFYAEAGGPGQPIHNVPFEDLRALGALTVPRGEFWNRHPQLDLLQIVKGIASAAHLYDQPSVEAEAFTSVWLWQEGPAELKPLADRAMAEGLNRFVYHTFPHTPPEAGEPGWVYNFGTLIYPHLSWWPKSKPFHGYLARTSYLLQQGHFVGDVLYYYGDEAPRFVGPKRLDPSLGFGYDYDVANTEVLLTRLRVEGGRLVLPHGPSYEILVLPPGDAMDLEALRKVEQLVRDGATVVGPRPSRTYGLADHARRDAEVRALAAQLWGPVDSVHVRERAHGRGRIVWGKPLRAVLAERGVGPDFSFEGGPDTTALDFIHRRSGNDEIYFVRNTRAAPVVVTAAFRVAGKVPERWDPESGARHRLALYEPTPDGVRLPLGLGPYGAAVLVFRAQPGARPPYTALRHDGRMLFPAPARAGAPAALPDAADGLWAWENGSYQLTAADGTVRTVAVADLPADQLLGGAWEVRFPHGWRAPARTTFAELTSWTDAADEGIRYFSGVAAYHRTFPLAPEALGDGRRVVLDLGDVREVAEVWVNGRALGIRWHAPYAVDVTEAARAGTNHLVVEVANVLNNRLVGDARLPAAYRRTKSNITKGPNAWMTPWADVPLKASGLLGPVRLRFGVRLAPRP